MTKKRCLLVCGLLGAAQTAYAQDTMQAPVDVDVDVETTEPGMYDYSWNDPRLYSGIGIGFTIGGGVNGFVDGDIRDQTQDDVGGAWAARMTIGTHTPLGLDVSYTGSTTDLRSLDAAGGDAPSPNLFTTTVEGALRWNMLPHYMINPYVFGGAGWTRLDINDEPALSDVEASEDLAVFPIGAGVAWRDTSGVVLDARGTYRFSEDATLLTGVDSNFDTWEASANLGYEF